MHLSPLSDGYLSDRDAGRLLAEDRRPALGRAHREGLLRGLVLLAIVSTLIAVGLFSSALHVADSEPTPLVDDPVHGAVDAR